MRIRLGLLLTALAIGLAQSASGGDAAAPQPQALLTFAAPGGGICAVRPDGSHARRLTPPWRLFDATWSPDGKYVAFVRATGAGNLPSKVSVADARGRIRWRFGDGHIFSPLWAPDGRHIAFLTSWAYSLALAVARSDGSELKGVADGGWPHSGPFQPAWSRDGPRIAFVYDRNIYSARGDGSDRRLLVPDSAYPAYSPDGTKLAYMAQTGGGGVFVANADGSDPHEVSSRAGWGPSWSPDGKLLAFAIFTTTNPEVVVANADGSGERVIANVGSRYVRSAPLWSPDGALVAFIAQSPAADYQPVRSSIVVANADGRGWRVIVRRYSKRPLQSLAWRPAVALPAAKRPPCSVR